MAPSLILDSRFKGNKYSSHIRFTISKPIPKPPSLLFPLLYLLNISFCSSGVIPIPKSFTLNILLINETSMIESLLLYF